MICSGSIIIGGLKKVAKVSEIIVPIMVLGYIGIALIIVLMNVRELPAIFMLVIKSAFGVQKVVAGGVGYTIAQSMQAGIARGLFSNEAGMGSAANIAASASPKPNHPASRGFIQMMGVFVDTIVICIATAAIILLAGDVGADNDGIAITIHALTNHVGAWGGIFIGLAILLFCFTSIIAGYSYAETNLLFLTHNNKKALPLFRICVLAMVMFGAVAKVGFVWNLADLSMGLMATVNIIALLMLSKLAIKVTNDYRYQLRVGKTPSFNSKQFSELANLKGGIWNGAATSEENNDTAGDQGTESTKT